ncbi:hypothetical protein [Clostridium sp. LP20]|uniref:hypothetical protein n=1 Tax=Clostridium sp. LP20 TaxID=3418665 RepID=UPI003EE64456
MEKIGRIILKFKKLISSLVIILFIYTIAINTGTSLSEIIISSMAILIFTGFLLIGLDQVILGAIAIVCGFAEFILIFIGLMLYVMTESVIVVTIYGVIVLAMGLFFAIRFINKRKNNNYKMEENIVKDEYLENRTDIIYTNIGEADDI